MDRGPEAESLHLSAIELSIEINGPRNPNAAKFVRDLANLYAEQERFEESEEAFLDSIRIFIANYGQSHYEVRRTYLDFAAMLAAAGRDVDAKYYDSLAASIPAPKRSERSGDASPATGGQGGAGSE